MFIYVCVYIDETDEEAAGKSTLYIPYPTSTSHTSTLHISYPTSYIPKFLHVAHARITCVRVQRGSITCGTCVATCKKLDKRLS